MNFAPVGAAGGATDNAASTQKPKNDMGKDAFMQLLVAQIRNQNPLDPADGVEFLTQLAQFSHLEQSMGIREGIQGLQEQMTTVTDALAKITEPKTQGETNV